MGWGGENMFTVYDLSQMKKLLLPQPHQGSGTNPCCCAHTRCWKVALFMESFSPCSHRNHSFTVLVVLKAAVDFHYFLLHHWEQRTWGEKSDVSHQHQQNYLEDPCGCGLYLTDLWWWPEQPECCMTVRRREGHGAEEHSPQGRDCSTGLARMPKWRFNV